MNAILSPAAACLRKPSVFAAALLALLCGCMQGPAEPGSTFRRGLQREAWRTQEAYDQALLAHTEKNRREIPRAYWDPGIERLQPVKVYSHHANLVVVQNMQGGMEHGLYIYLTTSPIHPKDTLLPKAGVEGFVFREARQKDVFHFTRTSDWHQASAE